MFRNRSVLGVAFVLLSIGEAARSESVIREYQVNGVYLVSEAGDFDGDGFVDVVLGMPYGRRIVVMSGANGSELYAQNSQEAGFASAIAGGRDVDADGLDDVLVGAPHADGER